VAEARKWGVDTRNWAAEEKTARDSGDEGSNESKRAWPRDRRAATASGERKSGTTRKPAVKWIEKG